MKIQVTLTVEEAKRIIAKGIAELSVVKNACLSGKIFFKGGTTVSAVCEELAGEPLSILGRISPPGALTAKHHPGKLHCAMLTDGKLQDADEDLEQAVEEMSSGDVVIIGANLFDADGNAAMMYGAFLGGPPGRIISGLMAECENVIIAVGSEKLVPGYVPDLIKRTSRRSIDMSMGMAVGLTPIVGTIVTEVDAVRLLAQVDCHLIGKGGLGGAEGASTLVIDGEKEDVERIFQIVESVKSATVSGIRQTLANCEAPQRNCALHHGCIYKKRAASGKRE